MESAVRALMGAGLTETEASIYLAGWRNGPAAVKELTMLSRIKRPTVYHALSTLMQKGLAAKKRVGGSDMFSMTPPSGMKTVMDARIAEIEERKRTLDAIVPLLAGASGNRPGKTEVMHYEGIDGVKAVVEEALYCKTGKWDIIAPRKNFFSDFDKGYARYFLETRKRRKIVARSLWERSEGSNGRASGSRMLSPDDVKERQPRYLPEVMHGKFGSVIIIFDDKVAFISSIEKPTAVLIRSPELKTTMSALFEGLWACSQPYGK